MRKKIFIVSENKKHEGLLFNFFYKNGYLVKMCAASASLLPAAREFEPNVVLCDVALAGDPKNNLVGSFRNDPKLANVPLTLIVPDDAARAEWEKRNPRARPQDFLVFPPTDSALWDFVRKWLENESLATPAPAAAEKKEADPLATMTTKGKVDCRAVGRLLFRLLENRAAGDIVVQSDKHFLKAVVRDGLLVEVGSDYIWEDTFGAFLIRLKKITRTEHEASLRRAQQMNVLQGEALVRLEVITDQDRKQFLQQQKTLKFLRLFQGSWDGADYEFAPGVCELHEMMTPVPLSSILKDGILNIAPSAELLKTFFPVDKRQAPLGLTDDFPVVCHLLDLPAADARAIDGCVGKSLDELSVSCADTFARLLRIVCLLRLGGALRVDKAADDSRPGRAAAIAQPAAGAVETIVEARLLFDRGEYSRAAPLLRQAVFDNPKSADALAMLAWVRFESGAKNSAAEIGRCCELLERALKLDPANARAYYYLGRIKQFENKPGEASSHFQKAGLLDPDDPEIRRELERLGVDKRRALDLK
jgi:tetratricopeptide (TPR) repeat protein